MSKIGSKCECAEENPRTDDCPSYPYCSGEMEMLEEDLSDIYAMNGCAGFPCFARGDMGINT